MDAASAQKLLRKEAGHAFDPTLVARFLDALPGLTRELETHVAERKTAGARPDHAPPETYVQIAEAHRELDRLYDIARSMGTTLGLADTMTKVCGELQPWCRSRVAPCFSRTKTAGGYGAGSREVRARP